MGLHHNRMPIYLIVRAAGGANAPKMDQPLVIRDMGPWINAPTITNGIEDVIAELRNLGLLPPGRRLIYYDSEGQLTEAFIVNGCFAGYSLVHNVEGTTP